MLLRKVVTFRLVPACRRWIECGVFQRWCNVQLTYCAGVKRALECAMSPMTSLRLSAPPETILGVLRDAMASIKVSTCDPVVPCV